MRDNNRNTGACNTGYSNTGYSNTGYSNTGDCNTGDWNIGSRNTGDCNTGDCNTGDWNIGSRNTGNWNTGDCNTGDWNIGDWNIGSRNTGYSNTGYSNTGNWNTVNKETGFFNTVQSETIRVFNKNISVDAWDNSEKPELLYFGLTEWIGADDMTDAEKLENPTHETTGGYLREYGYKEAFQKSYNEASKEDRALLLRLPGFDADVFFEISGIDVRNKDNSDKIDAINKKIKELQAEVDKLNE